MRSINVSTALKKERTRSRSPARSNPGKKKWKSSSRSYPLSRPRSTTIQPKQVEMRTELDKITAKIAENNARITELNEHINAIKKEYKKELDKTQKDQNKLRAEFDLQFIEYYESLIKKTVRHCHCRGRTGRLRRVLHGASHESPGRARRGSENRKYRYSPMPSLFPLPVL